MTAQAIERNSLPDGEMPGQPDLIERRMEEIDVKILEALTVPGSDDTPDELSLEAAAELLETDPNLLTWAAQSEAVIPDPGDEKRDTFSYDELFELNSKPYLRSVWVGEVRKLLEVSMGDVLDAAKDQGLSPDIPYNPAGGKGHELLGYYDLNQVEVIKAAIKAKRLSQAQPPEEPVSQAEPTQKPKPESEPAPEPAPEPAASRPKPPRSKPTRSAPKPKPRPRPKKPKPKSKPKPAPALRAEAKPQSPNPAQLPTGHIPLNKVLEVVDEQTDIGPALFLQSMRKLGIEPKELPGGQTGGGPVPYIAEDHVAQVLLHAKQNRTGVPVKDR